MKNFILIACISILISSPCFAMRPHTNYTYEPYPSQRIEYYEPEPAYYPQPQVQEVVVRNKYDGINTTANVISAISNLLTAIRVLSW